MSTPHVTSAQVVAQLGSQGVDSDMAAHLAVVASEMVDVQWGYDEAAYPWIGVTENDVVPESVVRQTLDLAARLYDNALTLAGTKQVTFDDVGRASADINSFAIAKKGIYTRRWHSTKGMVG